MSIHYYRNYNVILVIDINWYCNQLVLLKVGWKLLHFTSNFQPSSIRSSCMTTFKSMVLEIM